MKKLMPLAVLFFCTALFTSSSANWIVFPDNKYLLTYHSVTTADGKSAPIYPPQDPNASWTVNSNTYYLFDNTGKVLAKGYGL